MKMIVKFSLVSIFICLLLAGSYFLWPKKDIKPVKPQALTPKIEIRQQDIVNYLRLKTPNLSLPGAISQFKNMPQYEKQALIDELVTREIYFRQAKALQKKAKDKETLIASYQADLQQIAVERVVVSDFDLKTYYEANKANYVTAAHIQFDHVVFASESDAMTALVSYNRKEQQPVQSLKTVSGVYSKINARFGGLMTTYLFAQSPSAHVWYGPYESDTGYHVVKIRSLRNGKTPTLYEISDEVKEDLRAQMAADKYLASKKKLLRRYDIEIEY